MLKDSCVFIGVGQCGGNIVRQLELKGGYSCFYINSSTEDLETIGTDYDKQHHIAETKGMAKDRNFAKEIISTEERNYLIAEKVFKRYANAKIYTFVFSASGGTGGGMSNKIMEAMKEWYPDKIINAIVVKPHSSEDMIMQYNALECLKELKKLLEDGIVTNLQIVDNNKRDFKDKMKVNSEVASLLDGIMSFDEVTAEGNLDAQELEIVYSTKGVSIICEFEGTDFANELSKAEQKIPYSKYLRNGTVHGIILNKDCNTEVNRAIIKDTFGYPLKTMDTVWEYESNIVFVAGTEFNDEILEELKKAYLEIKKKREEVNEKAKDEVDIDIDFSELTTASTNINTKVQRPDRRRRVGVNGEMSRYRR